MPDASPAAARHIPASLSPGSLSSANSANRYGNVPPVRACLCWLQTRVALTERDFVSRLCWHYRQASAHTKGCGSEGWPRTTQSTLAKSFSFWLTYIKTLLTTNLAVKWYRSMGEINILILRAPAVVHIRRRMERYEWRQPPAILRVQPELPGTNVMLCRPLLFGNEAGCTQGP